MAFDPYKNLASGTVSTGYDAAATSIVLTTGHGARFPAITAPATGFNAVWWNSTDYADPSDDPNVEFVRVTAVSTDTLTVTRAVEGSSASTKNTSGKTYRLAAVLTAKLFGDFAQDPATARKLYQISSDLENCNGSGLNPYPFSAGTIGAGSGFFNDATISLQQHPGIAKNNSGGANYGAWLGTLLATGGNQGPFILAGGEVFELIFQPLVLTNVVMALGFHTSITAVEPIDGVYVLSDGAGNLTFKTSTNSTRTAHGTTYAASTSTWYRLVIAVNADASRVDCYLYNDSGTLLWNPSGGLTTNIPTARRVGALVTVYQTSGTGYNFAVDRLSVWINRDLTR